jgi:DNA-binding transcriptional MocR family regulator
MTIHFPLPDARGPGPRYLALADAIEAAVASGALPPGAALPTHRELAAAMGVTVGTGTRGYAEAARRGLVRGERGRGTYVGRADEDFARLLDQGAPGGAPGAGAAAVARAARGPCAPPGPVDMGLTAAYQPLGPDLGRALARIARSPGLDELVGRYGARGLPRHRELGAAWAGAYGCPAQPGEVLVTAGAQHALLVALGGLLGPGERLAVESLTYPLVKPLAKRLRLHLVPVDIDAHGLDPDALARACARQRVHGLYVMPACQNPTTAHMPEYRRHEVVAVCRRFGLRIIEDDVYALTVDESLPPLAALAPELGCFVAATSKVLCDSLRVAFLRAPGADLPALEAAVEWTSWKAAPLMVEVLAQWLADGTVRRTIEANRAEAGARNALLAEALGPGACRARPTGYYAWLPLPRRWRAVDFAAEAARRGVVVAHGEHFAVGAARAEQGVRLSLLGARSRQALRQGLDVLAGLLRL